jgi:hypothetical protein
MDKATFDKLLTEEIKAKSKPKPKPIKSNSSWFEVIQVIKRSPEGLILEWYPGDDKFKTKEEADKDLADLKKSEASGLLTKGEHVVVHFTATEV